MAASIKSQSTASAVAVLAGLRRHQAELTAGARTAEHEIASLRAGLGALALQPQAYDAQFAKIVAAEDRRKRLNQMAVDLEPQIAEAEKLAAREALLDERAQAVRSGDALTEEFREAEPVFDRLADLFKRIRAHSHSLESLNSRLSEAGRVRTVREDGATVSSRALGFERVGGVRPEGWVDASVFIEQTHIPALREGQAAFWAGRRVAR